MGKSRRSRKNIVKSIMSTADKSIPVVDKGIRKVGTAAKDVAKASVPVIEKGVSAVYGTMATGLDLGVKGAETISRSMSKRKRSSHRHKMSGGRRTRRRHHKRH